jgi:hypothetical protein
MPRAAAGSNMTVIVGEAGFIVVNNPRDNYLIGQSAGFTTIGEAFQFIADKLDPMPPQPDRSGVLVGHEEVEAVQAKYRASNGSISVGGT